MSKHIHLWVDGSGDTTSRVGGWAWLLQLVDDDNPKEVLSSKTENGYVLDTTSQRMELTALLKGLQAIKAKQLRLTIETDSKYLVGIFSMGWKAKVNQDLIMDIDYELGMIAGRWTFEYHPTVHSGISPAAIVDRNAEIARLAGTALHV